MASSLSLLYCMSNSGTNPNLVADHYPEQCSLRQEFSSLKSSQSSNLSSTKTFQSVSLTSKVRSRIGTKLAGVWQEIHGSNNWDDMVDPLDPLLRQEIIRYGEFVVACYRAFELDPNSKRYLSCKYWKGSMLEDVGLGDSGYEVTKYVYATALDEVSIPIQMGSSARWIGYVAVSRDDNVDALGRRDIVIAFRGTVTNLEWMANLMSSLTPACLDPLDPRPDVMVEQGFLSLYTSSETSCKFGSRSCRDQLLSEVSRLVHEHDGEEISITIAGHSMGSSLALLLAYDIAELGLNKPDKVSRKEIPITVFSFGGPRVGNSGFKARCEELGVRVLRVVNVNDPIPRLPGVLFNERFRGFKGSCSCYAHVGVELVLDFFKMNNPSCVHDLENYIGLLKDCEGTSWDRDGEEDRNFIERAKGFLLGFGFGFGFERLQWRNSATNIMNLFQSQWT